MFVTLKSTVNPDFQDCYWNVYIKETKVPIKDLKDAQRICREFIEKNELGGGNWGGGRVLNDKGEEIAHISYNGRAWKGNRRDWTSSTVEIFSLEEIK